MRVLILALVLVLSSCATSEPIYKPVEVMVPVKTLCTVTWPTEPVQYLSNVKSDASVLTKGNAAITELKQYRLYVKALNSALNECLSSK